MAIYPPSSYCMNSPVQQNHFINEELFATGFLHYWKKNKKWVRYFFVIENGVRISLYDSAYAYENNNCATKDSFDTTMEPGSSLKLRMHFVEVFIWHEINNGFILQDDAGAEWNIYVEHKYSREFCCVLAQAMQSRQVVTSFLQKQPPTSSTSTLSCTSEQQEQQQDQMNKCTERSSSDGVVRNEQQDQVIKCTERSASSSGSCTRRPKHAHISSFKRRASNFVRLKKGEEDEEKLQYLVTPLRPSVKKFTGWLVKRGGMVKSWKRRYFILTNNTLAYYTINLEGIEMKGSGIVIGLNKNPEAEKELFFHLHTGRTIIAKANSKEEFDDWVRHGEKLFGTSSSTP